MTGDRVARWLPAVLVLAVAVWVGVQALTNGADDQPPLAVTSNARPATRLNELVAASDVVVLAQVTGVDAGRSITNAADPSTGIKTRLVELTVAETLKGVPSSVVILEEEASLLDGTPIVVDGVRPSTTGDSGLYFLVAGNSEEFPYLALVGAQGRFLVGATGLLEPSGTDPLSARLAGRGLENLSCDVLALEGGHSSLSC